MLEYSKRLVLCLEIAASFCLTACYDSNGNSSYNNENTVKCGNGNIDKGETCDDGNTNAEDGCSADCKTVEDGYECKTAGSACTKTDTEPKDHEEVDVPSNGTSDTPNDSNESVENCGTSHLKCKVEHAKNRCEDGSCAFTCEEGWTPTLDGKACEQLGNPLACGPEQITCQSGIPNAIDLCVRDSCTFKCAPNSHLSQDGKACDADTILACGSHDNVCNSHHGTPVCLDGICQYSCFEGYHPTEGNRSCEEDCEKDICENVLDESTGFHRGVIKGICGEDGRIQQVNNTCPDTDLCEMLKNWYENKTKSSFLVVTGDPSFTTAESFITEEIASYNLTASGEFDMNHCKARNNIIFSHPSCSDNNGCAIANTVDEKLYRKRCVTFTKPDGTQQGYLVTSGYLADKTNVLIFDKNPACTDDYYVVPNQNSQYRLSDQNIESIPCDPDDYENYPMRCYKTEYLYNEYYEDYEIPGEPECKYTFGNWYQCNSERKIYTVSVLCGAGYRTCNPDIDVHNIGDPDSLCIQTEPECSCPLNDAICAAEGKTFDSTYCQCVCNKSAETCSAEGKAFDSATCQCIPCENYCDGNTHYYCETGKMLSESCDGGFGTRCAVRKSDGYASCVLPCSAGDSEKAICSDEYGSLINLDGLYAIRIQCSEMISGGYAYFMSYNRCENGCENGVCK